MVSSSGEQVALAPLGGPRINAGLIAFQFATALGINCCAAGSFHFGAWMLSVIMTLAYAQLARCA